MTLVELNEYQSITVPLTPEEASALAGTEVVAVGRGWERGTYVVTAGPVVASLRFDIGLELRINPKLPVRRLVYLLAHCAGLATWSENLLDLGHTGALDAAIAAAFTHAAEVALTPAPRSDYFHVQDTLPEMRGRLDVRAQRRRFGLPLPLSVEFDDFGLDIVENQLILGAILQLHRTVELRDDLRRRLRRLRSTLEGVNPAVRRDADRPVQFTRLNNHLRPAVALARVVLRGTSFERMPGRSTVMGFSVDMNRLFEKFLEVSLGRELERFGGTVHAQRPDHLDDTRTVTIRPDLTWVMNGLPITVIDAKYKDLDAQPARDVDIYQAVAYCVGLGLHAGFLVYAGRPRFATKLALRTTDTAVTVTGLDLSSELAELRSSIHQLATVIAATDLGPSAGVAPPVG